MVNNYIIKQNKLFIGNFSAEELVKKYGSPLYVYNAEIIRQRFAELKKNITYPHAKFHYACKANTNPAILKLLKKEGALIETVSQGEVLAALAAGYKPDEIIFTCSNISKEELGWLIKNNITVNLDSLSQITWWGERKPNSQISLRINQGIGAGHHKHVITGGPDSKFGIAIEQLTDAQKIAQKYNLTISGLHQHIGSNVLDEKIMLQAIEKLLDTALLFPDLDFLDFGGGFGIPYKPADDYLNMQSLGGKISELLKLFMKKYGKNLLVRFEPGRYLVAESGMLLTTVTDIKRTPYKTFVGINSGFNHLLRPAMYNAYHEIINAGKVKGETEIVTIAGNVCESGDIFARDRAITMCEEGNIFAICNAGAYGYAMSSTYNTRPRPAEILIDGKSTKIITSNNASNS